MTHYLRIAKTQKQTLVEKKKDGREFRELFLLSNKSIRKIRLPEAYGKVCRSSCGWLLTVGCDHAIQLINPLSREIINLPKVKKGIKKLLIVTNNPSSLKIPLVVVLQGSFGEMGFCRPGDKKWTTVGYTNLIGERKRLFVVIRHGIMMDAYFSKETYKTKRFLPCAYDLEDGRWSGVNDLGKKTLFVGHSSSFWIEDTIGVIKSN
ncbi:hypothetical protein CTI12_AA433340 [Artemisia annua]|uniref:KIB1-4 beta-propeller domain-containing protein n=1 Tax=Artemisia annua TaxID=35608 RepID=A0A2U1M0D0_ARTAN|nr:hypothetical protein CTI12_AA433340 [Artemisia annua]